MKPSAGAAASNAGFPLDAFRRPCLFRRRLTVRRRVCDPAGRPDLHPAFPSEALPTQVGRTAEPVPEPARAARCPDKGARGVCAQRGDTVRHLLAVDRGQRLRRELRQSEGQYARGSLSRPRVVEPGGADGRPGRRHPRGGCLAGRHWMPHGGAGEATVAVNAGRSLRQVHRCGEGRREGCPLSRRRACPAIGSWSRWGDARCETANAAWRAARRPPRLSRRSPTSRPSCDRSGS